MTNLRKQDNHTSADTDKSFLATFDSWEDDRNSEEIIEDIYIHRTVSNLEHDSGLILENWVAGATEDHE